MFNSFVIVTLKYLPLLKTELKIPTNQMSTSPKSITTEQKIEGFLSNDQIFVDRPRVTTNVDAKETITIKIM